MIPRINKVKSILDHNIFWVIFSIFVSVMLWIYVESAEGEDVTKTLSGIDVTLVGEEALRESKGYIITNLSANSVSVEIEGPRTVLAKLRSSDLLATIDVSATSRTGDVEKGYDIVFPTDVDGNEISVTPKNPETLTYYVDKEASKTVELRGTFTGTVAEGYIKDEFIFDPVNVIVSGPESEIDTISHAEVKVEREEIDKTVTFDSTFELIDMEGNVITSDDLISSVETVNVSMTVKATKDIPFVIDLIDGGGATIQHTNVTYEPEYITISGDPTILEGINNINLGTIDLKNVNPAFTQTYKIVIPNEAENITGKTEVVVNVEVLGLETQKFEVSNTNLSFTNLSEQLSGEILSESIEVELRGAASSLAEVSPNNIRIVADLSEVTTTGTVVAPAIVYVDGFTDVGAIGTYEMYLRILEAE